jgi:16S rRNA (uracil1498-N3)-methyltransferase
VFVDDLDRPMLAPEDHHHLARVLRLRPGETVTVSDGRGGWRVCAWPGSDRSSRPGSGKVEARADLELEPTADVVREAAPSPPVSVGFALTKGQRGDWAVQKLTEIGVDRIMPFAASRSVVRWDRPEAAAHVGRWRRLARESAMQSRRVWLPKVEEMAPFADLVFVLSGNLRNLVLAEPGGEPPSLSRPSVLIGPEGGWSGEELAAGATTVSLGPTILRAETAVVVAGALFCALRASLIAEAPGKLTLSGASTTDGDEVRLPETGG